MILEGELPPGEHLQEIPLAQRMGVSRTPVRTALSVLGQEGLLDYRPKRGHVVRQYLGEPDFGQLHALLAEKVKEPA